jgi:hypothetical protein
MHQEIEYVPTPMSVDVDGVIDRRSVRYIGTARRQPDGRYVALADVGGALCWVEACITFERRR